MLRKCKYKVEFSKSLKDGYFHTWNVYQDQCEGFQYSRTYAIVEDVETGRCYNVDIQDVIFTDNQNQ